MDETLQNMVCFLSGLSRWVFFHFCYPLFCTIRTFLPLHPALLSHAYLYEYIREYMVVVSVARYWGNGDFTAEILVPSCAFYAFAVGAGMARA